MGRPGPRGRLLLQAARDGRFGGLRDFTRNVVVNEFAGPEPTPMMLDALVAYMFEFDWLPSPYLNRDGSLNEQASPAALRGEEIFTRDLPGLGNRSCSTCHIGSANFADRLRHDIGYGGSSPTARDSFFETPTLINVAHTAPYMHDGGLETLRDVVDWFDAEFALGLSGDAQHDLAAYLAAIGTGHDPDQRGAADKATYIGAAAAMLAAAKSAEARLGEYELNHSADLIGEAFDDAFTARRTLAAAIKQAEGGA